MTIQRNNTIDIIKGFLIVCVILGHVLLGSIDDNIFRYIIYSFHMPLFMFMSGYMISVSKISQMTFPDIFCISSPKRTYNQTDSCFNLLTLVSSVVYPDIVFIYTDKQVLIC